MERARVWVVVLPSSPIHYILSLPSLTIIFSDISNCKKFLRRPLGHFLYLRYLSYSEIHSNRYGKLFHIKVDVLFDLV